MQSLFDRQTYFHNHNYTGLYLANFFDTLGKSLVQIFSLVFLYQLGLSIPFIILFLALRFGFMGALSPLSLIVSQWFGVVATMFIAGVLNWVGIAIIVLSDESQLWLAFSSFIFFSLKGALHHPLGNGLTAALVNEEHRGRFNSFNAICVSLANLLSVTLGATLLLAGFDLLVLALSLTFFIMAALMYVFLVDKIILPQTYSFISVYRYLFSAGFHRNIVPFSLNTFLIVERFVLPLFIFIYFDDLATTAALIALAVCLELISQFCFGRRLDRLAKRSFKESVILRSSNSLLLVLSIFQASFAVVAQAYSRIANNIFNTAFSTNIQKRANDTKDPVLFTTAAEMALCFGELLFLTILAGLSMFIGESIFYVLFGLAFVSVWTIYVSWKRS